MVLAAGSTFYPQITVHDDLRSALGSQKDGWGMAFWFGSCDGCLGGRQPKSVLTEDPRAVLDAMLRVKGRGRTDRRGCADNSVDGTAKSALVVDRVVPGSGRSGPDHVSIIILTLLKLQATVVNLCR